MADEATGSAFQSAASLMEESSGVVLLSPGFRSVAAIAGWDEEALLLASLVVEDTPLRHSKLRKTPSDTSRRKRKSRRQSSWIPPVTLILDEDDASAGKGTPRILRFYSCSCDFFSRLLCREISCGEARTNHTLHGQATRRTLLRGEEHFLSSGFRDLRSALTTKKFRQICLEICYEPSTTPCGHSFCKKCLKRSTAACGRRCPKCRDLIGSGRSLAVNSVLWNTIQMLFPGEIRARRKRCGEEEEEGEGKGVVEIGGGGRVRQLEEAGMAQRREREEVVRRRVGGGSQERGSIYMARANLRAMASRAVQLRSRRRQ
ncbi:uncharacterized protein LOC144705007 isoform X1 [Wolffia australiana]